MRRAHQPQYHRNSGAYERRYGELDTSGKQAEPRLVAVINHFTESGFKARLATPEEDEMGQTDLVVTVIESDESLEYRIQLKTRLIDKVTKRGLIRNLIVPIEMDSALLAQAAYVSGEMKEDEIAIEAAFLEFKEQFLAYRRLVDRVRRREDITYEDINKAYALAKDAIEAEVAERNRGLRQSIGKLVFEP